jgi:hypothetical protein
MNRAHGTSNGSIPAIGNPESAYTGQTNPPLIWAVLISVSDVSLAQILQESQNQDTENRVSWRQSDLNWPDE